MSRTLCYVKCLDPETNKIYYFNKRSHEVLYSCPSGLETANSESLVQSDDETMCNYVCCYYLMCCVDGDHYQKLREEKSERGESS